MKLTPDEQHWIALRLLARARDKSRDLARLLRKPVTGLRALTEAGLRHEIAECQRLAGSLQEAKHGCQ